MIQKISIAVLIILNFFVLAVSQAEQLPVGMVSDKLLMLLRQLAREHITDAQLRDGSHVPAETAAEKAKPILPISDARRVVAHGVRSEMMALCSLNWEQDYISFMSLERSKKIWSDKQLAYMGLLHGVTMGVFEGQLKQQNGCTPAMKALLK